MSSRKTQANRSSLRQLLRQAQIPLGSQQALDEGGGRGPEHRVAQRDQLAAQRRQQVALPRARLPDGDHIDRLLEEAAAVQALHLQAQGRPERLQLEGAERLLLRQPRLVEQPRHPPLGTILALPGGPPRARTPRGSSSPCSPARPDRQNFSPCGSGSDCARASAVPRAGWPALAQPPWADRDGNNAS